MSNFQFLLISLIFILDIFEHNWFLSPETLEENCEEETNET